MATVKVNTKPFLRSLDSYLGVMSDAAGRALGVVALEIEVQARKNASGPLVKSGNHKPWSGAGPNVRTGWLRRNIRASRPVRVGFASYTADITSGANYSRFVEEGTSRTGKYPFMTPAFAKVEPVAQQIFDRAYKRFRS